MSTQLKAASQYRAIAAGVAAVAVTTPVSATLLNDDLVHPPAYPWRHRGLFASFDHGALRRGFQVYRQVCATCHSIELIRWRELVGTIFTKEEAKQMAKETDVLDGPGQDGEMFERPGKLSDKLPKPYTNEQQGRAANNGAYPPDLSLMVKARHEGHDYIMALLTGYMDPPAGKEMMPGLYYNPYFPGGGIAMPPPLQDEGVEYPDGTVATISQQARDISQFLNWTAEPESETRKKFAAQGLFALGAMALGFGYMKRYEWSIMKTRRIAYVRGQ